MQCPKRIIALASLILAGGLLNVAIADPPGADVVCDGLSGAAFGLCTAAVNVGCGDEGVDKSGCTKIQDKYEQITGATAPWTIPYCTDNTTCAETEFCKKEDGDCNGLGICAPIPLACIDAYLPVLACDGGQYDNYCYAQVDRKNIQCYLSGDGSPDC